MPDTVNEYLDPPSPPTQLDYAKRQPLPWISRHWKLLIFLATCIAIGTSIYRYREPLKHRLLWLYWSHRAASFVMPGPIEVSIRDGVQAEALVVANGDYVRFKTYQLSPSPVVAGYSPYVFRQLVKFDPRLGMNNVPRSITFMGALARPDGRRRLVVLEGALVDADHPILSFQLYALPIPGWFDSLPQPPSSKPTVPISYIQRGGGDRYLGDLRAGVSDVNDRSRVVFQLFATPVYQSPNWIQNNVKLGEIDGYLQNDDSMRFVLRRASGGTEDLGTKASMLY